MEGQLFFLKPAPNLEKKVPRAPAAPTPPIPWPGERRRLQQRRPSCGVDVGLLPFAKHEETERVPRANRTANQEAA